MAFGLHQTSLLYHAQQEAVEIHATLRPDRCRLCKVGLEFQTIRRCRECGKPCCERCRLIDQNRVVCFRCFRLSKADQKALMPARARNARGPTKVDRQALDVTIQAALTLSEKRVATKRVATKRVATKRVATKRVATKQRWEKRNTVVKVTALSAEKCRECGEPTEPGWGDYCVACGVEWSYGPGKVGVA